MDEIAGLLDGPRAHGAFLLRCALESPYAVRIEDEAPLTLVLVIRGSAVVRLDAAPGAVTATATATVGDVVVLRGPEPYTVCSSPEVAVQAVIGTDQLCTIPPGTERPPRMLGLRTWGHRLDADGAMLVGTYPVHGEVGARLVRSLPALTLLRPGDLGDTTALTGLTALIEGALDRDAPGQDVVLDRALDLLLASVLQGWFAGPASPSAARARRDPALGPALHAMEDDPARGWTVSGLARVAGLSRAAFARRFADQVGHTPMAWLTDLRLTLAAEMLRGSDLTLDVIAARVGYGTPFALSAAFLRERGVRPATVRPATVRPATGRVRSGSPPPR